MIEARAARKKGGALEPYELAAPALGDHDVEIELSHCGVCHSDVHLIDGEFGPTKYPLVPGHEAIGVVRARGPLQVDLQIGDRVGVGWQRSACLGCERCAAGDDNLCEASEATCVGHPGGFARRLVCDGRYAFPIPAALDSARAAPLLCGGITVFAPMRRLGVRPGDRVGVIGIGGLGHLAIRFAKALGAEVTAFSSTPAKAEEARRFGAARVVSSTDPRAIKGARCSIDVLISTVFVNLDWAAYLNTLRPNGTLCFVGVPGPKLEVPTGAFFFLQRAITGSVIGGRAAMREMLALAAQHDLGAEVEPFAFEQADAAVRHVRANRARYRAVLHM